MSRCDGLKRGKSVARVAQAGRGCAVSPIRPLPEKRNLGPLALHFLRSLHVVRDDALK